GIAAEAVDDQRPVLGIERIGALQASEAGGVVDAAQQGHEIEGGGLRIGVRRIRELHDRIAVGRRTDDMVQGQLTVDLLQGADGLEPLHLRPVGTQLGNQRVQRQRRPAQRPVDPLDPLGDQLLGRLSPTFDDAELGGHIGVEFADPPPHLRGVGIVGADRPGVHGADGVHGLRHAGSASTSTWDSSAIGASISWTSNMSYQRPDPHPMTSGTLREPASVSRTGIVSDDGMPFSSTRKKLSSIGSYSSWMMTVDLCGPESETSIGRISTGRPSPSATSMAALDGFGGTTSAGVSDPVTEAGLPFADTGKGIGARSRASVFSWLWRS